MKINIDVLNRQLKPIGLLNGQMLVCMDCMSMNLNK